MKHTARLAAIAALSTLSVYAAPFMAVGDGAELFVTSSLSVQADDNIYLDGSNESDDTILSFTPGLDLVFGKGTATSGNLYYKEEIRRYSDNSNQDGEFSNVGVRSKTDLGGTKYGFNASYAQIAQNDNDLRATGLIVRRDVTNLGANAEFDVTAKSSIGVGGTYLGTDYDANSYTDSKVWSVPVDYYYEATAKLDWSFGYRYRDTDQDGTKSDFTDHFVNIGARGEFTPKLTGQIRVGYNQRDIDGGGDDSGLGLDGNLTYAYSDKTNLTFNLSNDYGNSGTGDGTQSLKWGFGVNSKFTEQWSGAATLNVNSTEYPTRDDDFVDGLVSVTYRHNQYFSVTASAAYRDNSSTSAAAEFTNTVFSLGANIRY